MDIDACIKTAGPERSSDALAKLLKRFLDPAFGALPKAEIELVILNALEDIGALSREPQVYELVSQLRVTRAKARRLIYERELRRSSSSELDQRIKDVLRRPLVQKDGELFVLEVENPLVSDHLRHRVQQLGYASDGSFSPSLVKLPLDAITALIESCLDDAEIEKARKALVKAGAPDTSFRGVIKAMSRRIAERVADDAGDAVMARAADYFGPLLDGAAAKLGAAAKGLFRE